MSRAFVLFFAEETATGDLINRLVGTTEQSIRLSCRILGEQRERLRAAGVGVGAGLVEEPGKPILHGMGDAEVAVVLGGVAVRGCVPVVVGEQSVAQDAGIAEGEGEA